MTDAPEPTSPAEQSGAPAPDYTAANRPRGLDAWFAPGGEDAAPPERVADERRNLRLLLAMVVLLVAVPTVVTLIAFVGQLFTTSPG